MWVHQNENAAMNKIEFHKSSETVFRQDKMENLYEIREQSSKMS